MKIAWKHTCSSGIQQNQGSYQNLNIRKEKQGDIMQDDKVMFDADFTISIHIMYVFIFR